jgi:cobalt-zinc-cadmium resistance protein CzcA
LGAGQREKDRDPVGAFVLTIAVLPFLGTAFIPEMKEGSVVPGINRVPNISLEESIKMEMEAMRLVMQVPGVKSAVSGVGRGESPADPQGPNESTPIVSLKPRSEWPSGWTQDDIQDAMREKLKAARRADRHGPADFRPRRRNGDRRAFRYRRQGLRRRSRSVEEGGRPDRQGGPVLQGAQDLRIERISGQQYLSIEIDRQAIARLGINVADVNDLLRRRSAARWQPRSSRVSAASRAWCACRSVSATISRRSPTS